MPFFGTPIFADRHPHRPAAVVEHRGGRTHARPAVAGAAGTAALGDVGQVVVERLAGRDGGGRGGLGLDDPVDLGAGQPGQDGVAGDVSTAA